MSAEIRSARKKSRDKVRAFPDDDVVEDPEEEEEEIVTLEKPIEGAETEGRREEQPSQGVQMLAFVANDVYHLRCHAIGIEDNKGNSLQAANSSFYF